MPENNTKQSKDMLIAEIDRRLADKIIEQSNADLLKKLILQASTLAEAIAIAELGTTYKRTGFHFDKRIEKLSSDIKYFKKNEELSFQTDKDALTHKLIIGDNFDALQNLLIEYRGRIDVIYIDPPYGKDSMGEFAQTNYDNAITRDNLLSMLYPRLELAKQLMSESGVIFCSIDDKNQAYMKCLFDEVLGEANFIASIVWTNKEGGGSSDSKLFKTKHEYVLCYAKSIENAAGIKNVDIEDEARYRLKDEHEIERGMHQLVKLSSASIQYSKSLDYPIKCPDGSTVKPADNSNKSRSTWRWSKEKLKWGIENDYIVFKKDKQGIWQVYTKQYTNADKDGNIIKRTKSPNSFIDQFSSAQGSNHLFEIFGEKLFGYPKPKELIMWLIERFSNSDEVVVLDFFAGSGTTGQAVLELNKEDGGNRQFILTTANEITDTTPNGIAYDVTSRRLKRVMTGEDYDGTNDFKWLEKNSPLGDNLDVYDIDTVAAFAATEGQTPFDVIDETLYGKPPLSIKEKIQWVCENFEITQNFLEDDKVYKKRMAEDQ